MIEKKLVKLRRKPSKKRLARSVKKKRAIKTLNSYKNKDGTRKQTSIENRFAKILDLLGIHYTAEYGLYYKNKYRVYDFYITNGQWAFLAEVDGSYWHAQSYKDGEKSYSELTKIQKKNIRNDKFKDMIAKKLGIPLLRFTEDEVKRNSGSVIERIVEEIKSQGGEISTPLQENV